VGEIYEYVVGEGEWENRGQEPKGPEIRVQKFVEVSIWSGWLDT